MNHKTETKLNWINSYGGPLIILDQESLDNWNGNTESKRVSDYERACLVEEYVDLIKVGSGAGLVLGDEPNQTTGFSLDKDQLVIIRWVSAESESDIEDHLKDIVRNDLWENTRLELEFSTGNLFLFDSALNSGADEHKQNFLKFDLNPGIYTVKNLFYEPHDGLSLTIHKLEKGC